MKLCLKYYWFVFFRTRCTLGSITFSFMDQSTPNFFDPTWEGWQLIKFLVADLPKFGNQVNHPCLVARRLKKFHKDTPTSPEVIEPNTVNFRPNFKFSRLNFLGGPSSPLGVCASKPWPISSALKNLRGQHPLRAEMQSPKKVDYGLYTLGSITFTFMEQSTPNFFDPTWEGWQLIKFLVADLPKIVPS